MSSSRSRSSTSANQTQTTNTQNLNLQDNEGIALADVSGQVSITTTDFGALETAGEVSRDALELGRASLNVGADLAGRGLDHARDFGADALEFSRGTVSDAIAFGGDALNFGRDTASDAFAFGTRSLDSVTGFADAALQSNTGIARDALDFASEAGAGVLDFAKGLVGDTVSGLKDLSMQTSASTDDRVAKIAMYAFAAVAAAIVLPALFKS